jgi:hypothetical protein
LNLASAAPGPQDAVSELPPRNHIWDHELRRQTLPPIIDVVDGLFAVGANLLYAPPGLGKTWLAGKVEHFLAYGTPMNGWLAGQPCRVLVCDAESDVQLAQERSFSITRSIPQDNDDAMEDPNWVHDPESGQTSWVGEWGIKYLQDDEGYLGFPGRTATERFLHLRAELQQAVDEGRPYRYVRIDTMRLFTGARPRGEDIAEWDNRWSVALNRLGNEFNCAIILLHHTNKAADYSGSTGIAGGVTNVISMTRNPDNDYELLLQSEKTRRGRPFSYALIQNEDGVPEFTDTISAYQAASSGTRRQVVDALTRRPMTMSELCRHLYDANKNTVRWTVGQLQRTEPTPIVRYYKGAYELVDAPPPPQPAQPEATTCAACGERLTVVTPGQTLHPGCEVLDNHPPEPEPDPVTDEVPGKWSAFAALKDSIAGSRMHPVRFVAPAARDRGAWPLLEAHGELMVGEHRWTTAADLPATGRAAVLDRNGSYPSACSSVTVSPSLLQHTGPDGDPRAGGIFLIDRPTWSRLDIGHPLGKIVQDQDGPRVWVSAPHMALLRRLKIDVTVHDSWTGKPQGNLFAEFSQAVRDERYRARQEETHDAYIQVKRSSSIALRSLWSSTRSPFWRPDWSISIRAEAAVRHWAVAYKAVLAGATLLQLGSVDEVVWLAPDGSDDTWAPAGYRISADFGGVKHKDEVSIARGIKVPSPITLEQFAAKARR